MDEIKKLSRGKKVGLGCLGLVFLFAAISALTGGGSSEPTKSPSAATPPVTETVTPPAEPVKEEPTQYELDANIKYSDTAFLIENKEDRPWRGCKFEINGGTFKSGYIYRADMPAKDSLIIPFSEFTKSDGSRFNAFTTKPQNISIFCTDVEGKTGHNYFTI